MTARPRIFLSAGLADAQHRARNLQIATALEDVARVYLPQRDGGLLTEMVAAGSSWEMAADIIKRRDVAALRISDIVIAILTDDLVGAGVAFELGVADALSLPCWALVLGTQRTYKSPLIESAVSRHYASIEALRRALHSYASDLNAPPRLLICDLDGVLITHQHCSSVFFERYRSFVENRLTHAVDWAEAERFVDEHVQELGWVIDDVVVAGITDMFMRARAEADFALREVDVDVRVSILSEAYHTAYHAISPEAALGARGFLERVHRGGVPVAVVTNAATAKAGDILKHAFPGVEIQLVGDARKFEAVRPPEGDAEYIPGLARPLLRDRPRYATLLRELMSSYDCAPHETMVVGDSVELDLLAADKIGCRTCLVEMRPYLPWQRSWATRFAARSATRSLEALAERVTVRGQAE
jgi:phosphoglycolate phosphatase-like HAD superfamily hydrolase/nucleoside 2-deoxyribosyltransferase